MKKIIAMAVMVVTFTSTLSAQTPKSTPHFSHSVSMNFLFMPIYMKYGDIKGDVSSSTVQVPDGRGILKFNSRGGKFVNAVFTDAAGKTTKLAAVTSFTGAAPTPRCTSGETTGMFASSDGNMYISICKTVPLADGSTPLVVSLVLMAV